MVQADRAASPPDAPPVRSDLVALAALTLLWLAVVVVVGPRGEFPISDDWAYAKATRALLETGRLVRVEWTFVPLVTNAIVGAAFARVLGFSFETLRIANLVSAWAGLLGAYALVRVLGGRPGRAAFGAILVGLNPIALVLAFTFMSDVIFLTCGVWSLVCLVRALQRDSLAWLAAGLALALATTLSRHFGVVLFPAVMIAAALGRHRPAFRLAAWAVPLACAAAFLAVMHFAFGGHDTGNLAGTDRYLEELEEPWLGGKLARNTLTLTSYLGLFLAPVLGFRPRPRHGLALGAGCAALTAALLAAVARTDLRMPFGVDIVHDSWLGWISLLGVESLPPAPPAFWWTMAALGLFAGTFLAASVGARLLARGSALRDDPRLLLLLAATAYVVPFLPRSPFFDRYLLPALAPLAALLLVPFGRVAPEAAPGRGARTAGVLALALLVGAGVAGAHDNMTHHRARWALLEPLLASGVPATCIDGGFELGGWKAYDFDLRAAPRRFVRDDTWILTLGEPPPGYGVVTERFYTRWLPPRRERLLLLRRAPAEGTPPIPPACRGPAPTHRGHSW